MSYNLSDLQRDSFQQDQRRKWSKNHFEWNIWDRLGRKYIKMINKTDSEMMQNQLHSELPVIKQTFKQHVDTNAKVWYIVYISEKLPDDLSDPLTLDQVLTLYNSRRSDFQICYNKVSSFQYSDILFKVTGLDRVNDMWLNMKHIKKMKE